MSDHPMQPIEADENGTHRFKANAVVRWLLDSGPFDLNDVARQGFSREDYAQFTQLIGYSVSGWGDLSSSPPELVALADARSAALSVGAGPAVTVESVVRGSRADLIADIRAAIDEIAGDR